MYLTFWEIGFYTFLLGAAISKVFSLGKQIANQAEMLERLYDRLEDIEETQRRFVNLTEKYLGRSK